MSSFTDLQDSLKDIKCSHCDGTGECDDASPGDISFNEWTCHDCGGSGFRLGVNPFKIMDNHIKMSDLQIAQLELKVEKMKSVLTMSYKSMYLVKSSFGHQFPLKEIEEVLKL